MITTHNLKKEEITASIPNLLFEQVNISHEELAELTKKIYAFNTIIMKDKG